MPSSRSTTTRLALALRHAAPARPRRRTCRRPTPPRRAAGCAAAKASARLARDLVVARQVLGRLDHAADAAEALLGLRALAAALEPVVQRRPLPARLPQRMLGRVVLDVAHALDAAGHARRRPRRSAPSSRRWRSPAGRRRSGGRAACPPPRSASPPAARSSGRCRASRRSCSSARRRRRRCAPGRARCARRWRARRWRPVPRPARSSARRR